MAVAYEAFGDDIAASSIHSSDSESVTSIEPITAAVEQPHVAFTLSPRMLRMHRLMSSRWPYGTGFLHLILGLILSFMGLIEIITFPIVYHDGQLSLITLNKSNNFGIIEWMGLVAIVCGLVGVGSAFRKSISQIYAYFTVVVIEILFMTACLLYVFDAYIRGENSLSSFDNRTLPFAWHITACVLCLPLYICALVTFTQYYEDVCFGDLQCCRSFVHCLCPCVCPRVPDQEELLNDYEGRPPSLPM